MSATGEKDDVGDGGKRLPEALLWGLDPLFWTNVEMLVAEVHALKRVPERNWEHATRGLRPVTRAAFMGVVVGVENKGAKSIYLVDDGTSVIMCIEFYVNLDKVWLQRRVALPKDQRTSIKLGMLVHAQGTLRIDTQWKDGEAETRQTGREERRWRVLYLEAIRPVTDPNLELLHWCQSVKLEKELTSQPPHTAFKDTWNKHNDTVLNRTSMSKNKAVHFHTAVKDEVVRIVSNSQRLDEMDVSKRLFDSTFILQQVSSWRALVNQTGCPLDEVRADVPRALSELVIEGRLFQVKDGRFGIVDTNTVLRPAILVRLAKYDEERGLLFEQLFSSLRQDVRCQNISREQLGEQIQELLCDGHLFSPSKGRFRLKRD